MNAASEVGDRAAKLTLVCFAMKEEAAPFRKYAAEGADLAILVTGIGRKNTEKVVREFLRQRQPHRIFTCGYAGGLDPALKSGDAVFFTEDNSLATALQAAGAKSAKFFCASKIAITVAEKAELRRSSGANAVEMESEVVHEICRQQKIPCATVRTISDTAEEDLPLDFNKLTKPDLNLDYGKLFLAIAKSPSKILALMRLGKKTRAAGEKLAEVLHRVRILECAARQHHSTTTR
jgi:adenosylhomocysteine nucleosidase